jgi:hypothetical protein
MPVDRGDRLLARTPRLAPACPDASEQQRPQQLPAPLAAAPLGVYARPGGSIVEFAGHAYR